MRLMMVDADEWFPQRERDGPVRKHALHISLASEEAAQQGIGPDGALVPSRSSYHGHRRSIPALDLASPQLLRCSNKGLALRTYCYYNMPMPTWDEFKRRRNIEIHGLDFAGADAHLGQLHRHA